MAFQAFLIALIIFVGKADYFVGTVMLADPWSLACSSALRWATCLRE